MEEKESSAEHRTNFQRSYGIKSDIIQVLMCMIANTAVLSSGMTLGFTSVALPFMEKPNEVFNATMNDSSWIASIATISTPIGCLFSGPLLDIFGRKFTLLLINIPAFIGWLFIAINPDILKIYIGRFLTGFACGLSSIPATVYCAESSTSSMRGILVTGTSISISLGIVIVYTLGWFLQEKWQIVAFVCSGFPVVAFILTAYYLPESPVWFLAQGKHEKAKKSLMKLRGQKTLGDVQFELRRLMRQANSEKPILSTLNTLKALVKPGSYKPIILMNAFFFFQQLTGTFVLIFYAVAVVGEAGVTTDPFVVAVLIGVTRFCFTIVSAWMSRRFGRRPTAITSGIGMVISLLVLGTQLLIQHASCKPVAQSGMINAIPLIMILIYTASSTIGFLTLPWSMIGEVFPAQIRGVASGLTTSMAYLFSFIAVKMHPYMLGVLQKYGLFYFYGAMSLFGTVFVVLFLPETQGRSLYDIQSYFDGKKRQRIPNEAAAAQNSIPMEPIARRPDVEDWL